MSMRAITNNKYKSVSEMYRKFDAEVTGYYVTYRDTYGKPTRKEAIRMYLCNKMEIFLFVVEILRVNRIGKR